MAANKERYKSLDLLAAYREQVRARQNKSLPRKLIIALLLAAIFIVLGAVYVMNYKTASSLSTQLADIQAQTAAVAAAQEEEGTVELERQLEEQLAYNNELRMHIELLENAERPDSALFTSIMRLGGLYKTTCDYMAYDNGMVTLNCTAGDSKSAAEFAKALENGLLDGVSFTGYSMVDETAYSFTVQGIREVQ